MFATAFYLVVDVAEGRAGYATAGHPRPLHVRRERGTVEVLPAPPKPGPALGLIPDAHYTTGEVGLAVADVLLLFTDGLFEVASPDGREDYGKSRLQAAARDALNLPLPALCQALIAGVRSFAGGADFGDDVCLLGVEVAPWAGRRL